MAKSAVQLLYTDLYFFYFWINFIILDDRYGKI